MVMHEFLRKNPVPEFSRCASFHFLEKADKMLRILEPYRVGNFVYIHIIVSKPYF